ncbi:MAG: selenide, water dikinase SelD [Candidatus Riflebacteria bacterium]|nr:selenide, water dikinase SelD [Candidatus Riflebacteria bacterium]
MAIAVAAGEGEGVLGRLTAAGLTASLHPARPARPVFDLLTTVEYGGCSAKLPADLLVKAIRDLPRPTDARLLVGIDTCDDAGVYRLTDEIALIETTDFFPPICSDPFEFGQIAAANALSDVFAMGGRVLTCMNLVMFPAHGIPFEVLGEILRGGQDKVTEAGGIVVGGHTIADSPPKFGLAVTGMVHPDRVIANTGARPGEVLVLAKPVGTGALVAGQRIGEARFADYRRAIDTMRQLNRRGAEIMQAHGVRAATDITGFGLLGHARHLANGSGVTLRLEAGRVPALPGALEMIGLGCIPGGAFRNLDYVEAETAFAADLPYERKMLLLDPQTSGGLLMCLAPERAEAAVADLRAAGYQAAGVVGEVLSRGGKALLVTA